MDSMADDVVRTLAAGLRDGRCGSWAAQNSQACMAGGSTCSRRSHLFAPSALPLSCRRWGRPEVLVGHSIGGLIVLELAQRLGRAAEEGLPGELADLGVPRQVGGRLCQRARLHLILPQLASSCLILPQLACISS